MIIFFLSMSVQSKAFFRGRGRGRRGNRGGRGKGRQARDDQSEGISQQWVSAWTCGSCTFSNEYVCTHCQAKPLRFMNQAFLRSLGDDLERVKAQHSAVRRQISLLKHTRRIVDEVLDEMAQSHVATPGPSTALPCPLPHVSVPLLPTSSSSSSSSTSNETPLVPPSISLTVPSTSSSSTLQPSQPLTTSSSSSSLCIPLANLWDTLFDRATPERDASSPSQEQAEQKRALKTSAEFRRAISQLERELSEMQLKKECGICFDEPAAVTFSPCGHRFVCTSCSKALNASGHAVKCPLCREEVTAFLNAYPELSNEGPVQQSWTCQSCHGANPHKCEVCEGITPLVDAGGEEAIQEALRETRQHLFLASQYLQELHAEVSRVLAMQFPEPQHDPNGPEMQRQPKLEGGAVEANAGRMSLYEAKLQKLLQQVAQLDEQDRCQQCHVNTAVVTFFPCGHHTSCKPCAKNVKVCPSCGKNVVNLIVTYQA